MQNKFKLLYFFIILTNPGHTRGHEISSDPFKLGNTKLALILSERVKNEENA